MKGHSAVSSTRCQQILRFRNHQEIRGLSVSSLQPGSEASSKALFLQRSGENTVDIVYGRTQFNVYSNKQTALVQNPGGIFGGYFS